MRYIAFSVNSHAQRQAALVCRFQMWLVSLFQMQPFFSDYACAKFIFNSFYSFEFVLAHISLASFYRTKANRVGLKNILLII